MLRSLHFRAAIVVALLVTIAPAYAQEDGLPHQLAPSEIPLIEGYRLSRGGVDRGITSPPAFPVRTMAEWEEVSALWSPGVRTTAS